MARKRKTAMAVAAQALAEAANTDRDDLDQNDADDEDVELAANVLDGLRRLDQGEGGGITWYVYNDSIDDTGYIEKVRSDQLDEELFKQRYGPGNYRVVGKTTRGGQYVKGASSPVKISGVLSEARPKPNGAAMETDTVALLREMRAADDRRADQRAADNRSWAQALATPLATVAAAFISRPSPDVAALIAACRPQQSSLTEMTQALVSLQTLQGDKSGALDAFLKVLDRVQDMPDSGGGSSGWLGLAREILREAAPVAKEALSRMGQAGAPGLLPPGATTGPAFGPGVQARLPAANAPPSPPGAPPANGDPSPAGATAQQPEDNDMWKVVEPWLRRRVEELHEDAASNLDVELVADMLYEKAFKRFGMFVPPDQLLQYLQHPQWWELLIGYYQPISPYHAWVDDVRKGLIEIVSEEIKKHGGDNGQPESEG